MPQVTPLELWKH